jgi:hypothetical protein
MNWNGKYNSATVAGLAESKAAFTQIFKKEE